MSFIAASSFITTITSVFLGFYIYYNNRKPLVNITLSLLCLSVSVWSFFYGLMILTPNYNMGLYSARIHNCAAMLIPVFYLHFVVSLLRKGKEQKYLLVAVYVSFIFILLLSIVFPHYLITNVSPRYTFRYYPNPGILFYLYGTLWGFFVIYSIILIFFELKTCTGIKRNQLLYVFIASIVGFAGGATTFLSVFGVYPFGVPFVFLYTATLAYSILRHRLFDIDFVIRTGTIYAYASFLFLIPLFVLFLGAQYFIFKDMNFVFSVLSLLLITASAYIFPQIRLHAEQTVEQYVFKEKYDYKKTIGELSKAMVSILNMDDLCKKIINTTTEAMDVNKASVYIIDEDKDRYALCDSRGVTIGFGHVVDSFRRDDPFFKAVEQHNKIIIREEVERFKDLSDSQLIIQMMTDMESEICIPLIAKSRLIGLVNLGMKGNKRMYSHEDIEMLTTLANSATIAIENAQLIENMKKTKKVMARADRLAGIGQLAAGIAHEIRNPLVAIKTSAQLLPDRYNDEEFRTYFSTIVASEIDRATKKINDLLDYARPSAPFFQQENINEIIEGMVAFVKNDAYKKEQTIEINLSQELPTITLDRQQMKQVFINLLFNAIHSTPEKGKISITTKKRTKSNGPTDFIQVEVSDTGVGIPEEDLEKIFTPFFTTKAKEEGSGLGLAMTHQIIEEHEGTIDVQSRINQGTTFTINLPVNPLIFKQNKDDARNLH
jgi:signal transduction histidine kinase